MQIQTIGILEAKEQLRFLLDKVQQGEIFHIAKRGKTIAELRAVSAEKKRRKAGFAKGTFGEISEDFDAPLDSVIIPH